MQKLSVIWIMLPLLRESRAVAWERKKKRIRERKQATKVEWIACTREKGT